MNIEKMTVVSLTWVLQDTLGSLLDQSTQAAEFLVGGNDLLEKIEEALLGKQAGDRIFLHLEPEDAFGEFDETQIILESRALFSSEIEVGMLFEQLPAGCVAEKNWPVSGFWHITDLYDEHVILDGNHPLAGIAIRLQLDITGVRPALDEEKEKGSAGSGFFTLSTMPR